MTSPASRNPKLRVLRVAIVAVAVLFAATVWARAQAVAVSPAQDSLARDTRISSPNPFAERFPDVVLKTQEGKNVRFYDDLLKGKIVLINFMYANCKGR